MEIEFEASAPDLAGLVVGFVERLDSQCFGDALELPLLNPLLQFFVRGRYHVRPANSTGAFEAAPAAALWGGSGHALVGRHSQRLHVFVVILTNSGVAKLAGVPPGETADRRTAFADIWPRDRRLADQIAGAPSFADRVKIASTWLRGLPRLSRNRDALTLHLADRIADGSIGGTVASVASYAGLNVRTLRRCFERSIGRTPKESLRIARLQRVLRQIHPRPWRRSSSHDALLEYFDQAHFMKDFAQLTTLSPKQFRLAKTRTQDPLVNTVYTF